MIHSNNKAKQKLGADKNMHASASHSNSRGSIRSSSQSDLSENDEDNDIISADSADIVIQTGKDLTPERLLSYCQNAAVLSADELVAYAQQMENSRASLTGLIIESNEGFAELALEFIRQIGLGVDFSELVNKSINESNDPVQKNNSVQDTAKQLENKLMTWFEAILEKTDGVEFRSERDQIINDVKEIHFLPNFLQQVSINLSQKNESQQEWVDHLKLQTFSMCQARQAMINGNLRLVTFVARQYNNQNMAFTDLIQDGTVGLIKAVDRYDWRRSVRFSTYAIYWIRQTISRAMVRQEKIVRLPYNIAAKAAAVFEIMNNYLTQNNKWPSTLEVSELSKLPEEEVKAIIENYQPTVSLSSNINNDDEMPQVEATIEQHHYPQPMNILASSALKKFLRQAVATLTEREADIINCRFGLDNNHEMTLQDIADKLSLTRERVRQIQNGALLKLKTNFSSDLSDFLEPG